MGLIKQTNLIFYGFHISLEQRTEKENIETQMNNWSESISIKEKNLTLKTLGHRQTQGSLFLGAPIRGAKMGQTSPISSYCQTPGQSLDQELTLFYPCHINNNNNKTPHQNLSEGRVLEGGYLTHRLLMGFWLSLGGQGSEWPMSQEEQE